MRHNGDYRILHDRVRNYWRRFPAKVIARSVDIDERTAHGWRDGRLPGCARHWWAISQAFADFADVLTNPDQAAVRQRLESELHGTAAQSASGAAAALAAADRRAVEERDDKTLDLFGGGL